MSAPRRVAVTGYGVVAPCGMGKAAFWQGLLGPGLSDRKTSSIADWDPLPYFESPKEARRADRVEQFALAAAAEAFEQAGRPDVAPERFGTIFATGIGGLITLEEQVQIRLEKGERRVSPFLIPMLMANASGAAISMRYGLQGPNETIVTACAASSHAIGYAMRLIRWGLADAVVTGGSEACITPTGVAGFANMTALSSSGVSMPFDVKRDGFVMVRVLRCSCSRNGRPPFAVAHRSWARSWAPAAPPTHTTSRRPPPGAVAPSGACKPPWPTLGSTPATSPT
jgi:3-oxoacyl-[acyl-carrier-protein] synthase II